MNFSGQGRKAPLEMQLTLGSLRRPLERFGVAQRPRAFTLFDEDLTARLALGERAKRPQFGLAYRGHLERELAQRRLGASVDAQVFDLIERGSRPILRKSARTSASSSFISP